MDASSGEDDEKSTGSARESLKAGKRIVFGNVFGGKKRSATTIYSTSPNPQKQDAIQERPHDRKALTRSRSDEVGLRCRDEWAEGILGQDNLKESVIALRSSVADYEKEASQHQWKDFLKIHADIRELGKLAESSKKPSNKINPESADGLTKFSTVALEYSKLLDVVMNQSPEYAGLAWGAIKLLLVAHVNHSKLKHSVEHYLVEFGQQFGVVNQLMSFLPTEKMVEAVAEAYAAFSKFLAKAVKYYRESKLMSAVRAFAFPWETRFAMLVTQIEHAFKRIRDLASAGHYNATVQSSHLLRSISTGQEQLRLELHQESVDLRKQLKNELKGEVQALFDSFDRNWLLRFDQIMEAAPHRSLTAPPERAAIEYVDSISVDRKLIADTSSATFLADHVNSPKGLKRFRDNCFPLLQQMNGDDAQLTARLKHLKIQDLQQCMGLLRHESVREWLQCSHSSLFWVNTHRVVGIADWASAFSSRMIEYAGKIQDMTILYHFCGNHSTSRPVSTATVALQSLITRLLQLHHKKFARKVFSFTMEHFQDARDDFEELWGLLNDCLTEAQIPCVWLIIDSVDNLQKNEDYDELMKGLRNLAEEDSRVFKVFVTSRSTTNPAISESSTINTEDPSTPKRISIVTVPRAQSRLSAALLSKQKRPVRLPESLQEESPEAEKADIEALLLDCSEDDDLFADEEPLTIVDTIVESPSSITFSGKAVKSNSSDAFALSDSSLEFMKDDPFATSEESDWEGESTRKMEDSHLEDSDADDFSFLKRKESKEKGFSDLESSAEETEPSFQGAGKNGATKCRNDRMTTSKQDGAKKTPGRDPWRLSDSSSDENG